jgi:hypothetical protein
VLVTYDLQLDERLDTNYFHTHEVLLPKIHSRFLIKFLIFSRGVEK